MKGTVTFFCSLVVLGLIGLAWQLTIWIGDVPAYTMPSPAETLATLVDNRSTIVGQALSTAVGALVGLGLSLVIALLMAVTVVRWPALARPVTGYALIIRTLPIVGVAPLVTLVAGRGLMTSVLCVVIVTIFTLYVSAVEGMTMLPAPVADLADLYRTSFVRRVLLTWLPSAWSGMLVGLRIAGPLAVLAAILAEWLSGRAGVGTLMTTAQADREVPLLWAATVTAAIIGLLAYGVPGILASFAARRGYSTEPVES
ncbi:ABC transporter permease [Spirillospora sp. CA-255316]